MKNHFFSLALLTLLIGCNHHPPNSTTEKTETEMSQKLADLDTTPKVTGIGGVFFYTDSLSAAKDWYTKNLGIEINDWGSSSFESRDLNNPEQTNSLQWKPFPKGDAYFAPSTKDFMINYRVQNLEGLVRKLQENGVTLLDSIATYDYGKFVHLIDLEGTKIELWEPTE